MKVLIFLLAWLPAIVLAAETAYVTDRVEVLVRTGKGTQYKILRRLPSGYPVTVLERDRNSGYSRIRLRDGTEGWILTRYLSDQPSARQQLAQVQAALERLRQENAALKKELAELKSQQGSLSSERAQLAQRSAQLEAELQRIRNAAAHALEIQDERNRLRERVADLERQLKQLQLENQALSRENSQRWFLIGAGVLGGGILLGLILPRLGWRRKRGWDSLSSL
ncbi:SH3 domain protein [Methylomarinovum tepidoasis]|uniref:SH3 domain protein n=1 Tax=Methylomarinovum tepidoasis TaxID=2840183 RepID=A0AAU9CWC7_9GAMM|nr:TIGR04211 family SH3 domain-containing protein [Methylomarinovum sp. IN45]BCX89005.1 SH3 domain protein [Methylomarinovum sp. IN45]